MFVETSYNKILLLPKKLYTTYSNMINSSEIDFFIKESN